jgi:hypothetical protein
VSLEYTCAQKIRRSYERQNESPKKSIVVQESGHHQRQTKLGTVVKRMPHFLESLDGVSSDSTTLLFGQVAVTWLGLACLGHCEPLLRLNSTKVLQLPDTFLRPLR